MIFGSAIPIQRFKIESSRAYLIAIILLISVPVFVKDPYILNVLIIALIFSVLATSWNLISGYTGILTFGHQAFFGIGAYFSALLAMKAGVSPWLGLPVGGIVAAFFGFLIGLPCLRLRAAPYIATTTLALAEIARVTCMNLVPFTRGELGLWGIPNFPEITLPFLGQVTFSGGARISYYYVILVIFLAMMTLFHFIFRSHIGLAFGAIRDSRDAAQSLGVNITYYKLLAFVTSAFFAGVAGSFYAHYLLILTPTSVFSIGLMIEMIAMAMVGGVSTFMGPVLGSFLLTLGLEYLRFMGEYRFITYGILLVVIILFMPQGLGQKFLYEKKAFGIS